MLQAILNGKLSRQQQNMEDILTSCVFGVFVYWEPDDGVGRFLQEARGEDPMDRPFAGFRIQSITYDFWPNWNQMGIVSCEPDVVLRLETIEGQRYIIVIEVKYRSGKSAYATDGAEAPTDQLAKEWDNLQAIAAAEMRQPVMLYVTADLLFPSTDIEDARMNYMSLRTDAAKTSSFACYWISWRSLYQMFSECKHPCGKDLAEFAKKMDFLEFDGFSTVGESGLDNWHYRPIYRWKLQASHERRWRYES